MGTTAAQLYVVFLPEKFLSTTGARGLRCGSVIGNLPGMGEAMRSQQRKLLENHIEVKSDKNWQGFV